MLPLFVKDNLVIPSISCTVMFYLISTLKPHLSYLILPQTESQGLKLSNITKSILKTTSISKLFNYLVNIYIHFDDNYSLQLTFIFYFVSVHVISGIHGSTDICFFIFPSTTPPSWFVYSLHHIIQLCAFCFVRHLFQLWTIV